MLCLQPLDGRGANLVT